MVVTFITGNLKDCLKKKLVLLQRVIIVLPQTSVVMLLKREKNVKEAVRNKIHLIMEK